MLQTIQENNANDKQENNAAKGVENKTTDNDQEEETHDIKRQLVKHVEEEDSATFLDDAESTSGSSGPDSGSEHEYEEERAIQGTLVD